ncbi:MAG: hypothetical protein M1833_004984 [Piccolia ochrophora]|nr:MAG: hypothetical protein M1833_004984 [Piccolia ochrophora]
MVPNPEFTAAPEIQQATSVSRRHNQKQLKSTAPGQPLPKGSGRNTYKRDLTNELNDLLPRPSSRVSRHKEPRSKSPTPPDATAAVQTNSRAHDGQSPDDRLQVDLQPERSRIATQFTSLSQAAGVRESSIESAGNDQNAANFLDQLSDQQFIGLDVPTEREPTSNNDTTAASHEYSSPTSPSRTSQPSSHCSPPRPLTIDPGSPGFRRTSMHTHRPSRSLASPPLPHHAQQHFYSAPVIDLDDRQDGGQRLVPGETRLFAGLDSLADAGGFAAEGAPNALLVGYDARLDVYKVGRNKPEIVGRIDGLRGGVIAAKLLPQTSRNDPFSNRRPLVALIIHGLSIEEFDGERRSTSSTATDPPSTASDMKHPMIQARQSRSNFRQNWRGETMHYQTTVEVYSLKAREHIATLFSSAILEVTANPLSRICDPPRPIGDLQVDASGRRITVSSGSSGEVFIYTVEEERLANGTARAQIRCLGKIWTSTRVNVTEHSSNSSQSSDSEVQAGDQDERIDLGAMPLISLSQRWLAYVPPLPSTSSSINGRILVGEYHVEAPGLSSHTPMMQPQINCATVSPDVEGFLNRVAREMTQELIKGARWMGDQGLQAWRNYWNPPSTAAQHFVGPSTHFSQRRDQSLSPTPSNLEHFPPTHAHLKSHKTSSETSLVSIIDLERAAELQRRGSATPPEPIATFQVPFGCSFLSFAPHGLTLLSASGNGDVQFIWNLMGMRYGAPSIAEIPSSPKGSPPSAARQGQQVRQTARFSRMTIARIVDVVWTTPSGDKLAIVTEKGTVHLFDLPLSAFQWPPQRRSMPPTKSSDAEARRSDVVGETGTSIGTGPVHAVSAAVKMVNERTQPLLAAARGRRRSSGPSIGGMSGATGRPPGLQGSRMVSSGLSKSLGAATGTINNLRRVGENRLHLPSSGPEGHSRACVRWLSGKETGSMGVIGGGLIRFYSIAQKSSSSEKSAKRSSVIGVKSNEYPIPLDSHEWKASRTSDTDQESGVLGRPAVMSGFWDLRSQITQGRTSAVGSLHPLSHAEIESNPPFQPFHTDPRVDLYVYQAVHESPSLQRNQDDRPDAWVFGEGIDVKKLDVGRSMLADNKSSPSAALLSGLMENVLRLDNEGDGLEQIVVTTRRRKRANHDADEADDGFFEDDCEVLDFASDRL